MRPGGRHIAQPRFRSGVVRSAAAALFGAAGPGGAARSAGQDHQSQPRQLRSVRDSAPRQLEPQQGPNFTCSGIFTLLA